MRRAVCGFLFDPSKTTVVLIRKNRPDWQKGLLNGVGGKVEEGESFLDAMVREFREETGVFHVAWEDFCVLQDEANGYEVHYYRSFGDVARCRSVTDESVEIVMLDTITTSAVLPNLRWLIPMALDPQIRECSASWRAV